MFKEMLLVGCGGFAGSALRYCLSTVVSIWSAPSSTFPWGTLSVNTTGSLLIGMLMGSVSSGSWLLFGATGFCGGFTTFSAFSLESLRLMKNGAYLTATAYIAASILACLACVWLGVIIGSKIIKQ